jgi:putative peptidyl-prolyl cis-trans isomerase
MKRIIFILFLMLMPALVFTVNSSAWEKYDRIVAVVNSIPIIESELNTKFRIFKSRKHVTAGKINYYKSRVLDVLIEDALVLEAARKESIRVSDKRILTQIEKIMKGYFSRFVKDPEELNKLSSKLISRLEKKMKNIEYKNDPDLDQKLNTFINYVERNQKLKMADYFEEMRVAIRKEQVMSIAIGASPPSDKDVEKWYNQNRAKIGDEVRIQIISIHPKGRSLTDQMKTNKYMESIRQRALKGESFSKLARKYSQHGATRYKGGDTGWIWIAQIAQSDNILAFFVDKLRVPNQISKVIKGQRNYHVVKLLGRRPVSMEKVEKMIRFKLYNEKMGYQFKGWIKRRKEQSDIRIFFKNYIKG